MTQEQEPAVVQQPAAAPAPEPKKDEWFEKLRQRELYNDAVAENKKDPVFAKLFDKYENDVKALNPNIVQTVSDHKKFGETFLSAAKVLFERDEKIQATQTPPPQAPAQTPADLDQPVPRGDGIQKNAAGEVFDSQGTRLISETVRLPDLRNVEIPADATPVERARLINMQEAQSTVKKWEKTTW